MAVNVGSRLGPYEIVARLGAGGMGEVFKARDPRLERSVAIKVLPAAFSDNAQLKARFEREAKTISQLNHPHICTVHDYGHDDGTSYLVMELVEGETIAERLRRGPLPLADVLRYGAQIAEALERAHRAGIVHRDLKPGNVMITRGGAKLLDFGLARSSGISSAISPDAPTVQALTGETHVVGTLPYMAPEQLHGSDLDARTDIFALGALLYEMVTGQRAFSGASAASLIAHILEHEPPSPSTVQAITPPALEHIILTCLAKDPDARFQSAADVAHELRWIASTPRTASATLAPARTPRWLYAVAALLLLLALAATAVAVRAMRRAATAAPPTRFLQLTFEAGEESHPTLSPDGKLFAFAKGPAGGRDIFLQRIDGRSAINLTNTPDADDAEPAFSPDGNLIAFRSSRDGGGIFVMGATGESVRRLTDVGFNPSWSPDGKSIVASGEQTTNPQVVYGIRNLYVIDAATAATRVLYAGASVMQPVWSPNGQRIAFWTAIRGVRDIYTIAANGDPKSVVHVTADAATDWNPVWSPDGRHLYFSSDRGGTMNLWRVPIDEESGAATGAAEAFPAPSPSAALLSISRDGRRAIYQSVARSGQMRRLSLDPASERITPDPRPLFSGSMAIHYIAASPDEKWIAFTATAPHEDVYIMAADGSGIRQLTNDPARDRGVDWWPDGSRIIFYSNRDGEYDAWSIRPDGSGLTRISAMKEGVNFPKISPDGKRMAFNADSAAAGGQIADLTGAMPVRTAAEAIPDTPRGRFNARAWSPDGQWIVGRAYGVTGVYVYHPATKKMLTVADDARAGMFVDDRRVLFVDARDRFHIAELPTMRTREIGALPEDPLSKHEWNAISGTRNTILLHGTRTEGDIWMAEVEGE